MVSTGDVRSSHKCQVYKTYKTWSVTCSTCDWWVGINYSSYESALELAFKHRREMAGYVPGWRERRARDE